MNWDNRLLMQLSPEPQEVREPDPTPRPVERHRSKWLLVGALMVVAGVGSALLCLFDLSSLKARVLMGIAGTSSDKDGGYSFVKKHSTASNSTASAVAVCENLVRLKPTDARARVLLGDAYAGMGRTQEAMTFYQEALGLDNNCFEAHLALGKAHAEQGHYPEAISSYQRALQIRPDSADAQLSLGLALSNAGQYEEAMRAFQRAKELDPGVAETQVITGKAFLGAGMYAQAIECLENAVQTDEEHAQAYFNLGRAYLRVGDRDLAIKQQHILQNLDPQLADELEQLINN